MHLSQCKIRYWGICIQNKIHVSYNPCLVKWIWNLKLFAGIPIPWRLPLPEVQLVSRSQNLPVLPEGFTMGVRGKLRCLVPKKTRHVMLCWCFHIYFLKCRSKRNTGHWKSKCKKRLRASLTLNSTIRAGGFKRIQSRYNVVLHSHGHKRSYYCACFWRVLFRELITRRTSTGRRNTLLKRRSPGLKSVLDPVDIA